jgi:hypothetical protein
MITLYIGSPLPSLSCCLLPRISGGRHRTPWCLFQTETIVSRFDRLWYTDYHVQNNKMSSVIIVSSKKKEEHRCTTRAHIV